MEWLEERWFSAATKERHAATWKYGYILFYYKISNIFTSMLLKMLFETYLSKIKKKNNFFYVTCK